MIGGDQTHLVSYMISGARALTLVAALAWPLAASAQNVVTLQYNFSNPGARSLGLGGAFVALADDATAAYANPAGLTQLAVPEVSIEGRSWQYSTTYTKGGRASGAPTGIGLDTTSGIRKGVSRADFTELSFLSLVYPKGRFTFALYRHQLARFASSFEPQGLFGEGTTLLATDRWIDQPGSNQLDLVSFGLALGFRLTDSLSIGLGVSRIETDFTFSSAAYLPDEDSFEGFFGSNSFLPERQVFESSTEVNGTDAGRTVGVLWRPAERWRVGAFHRQGFTLDSRGLFLAGPAAGPEIPPLVRFEGYWQVPESHGAGLAYQTADGRLTTSFEWDHVSYSQNLRNDPDERIPDTDELHLGGEYVLLDHTPVIAVRLGAWIDPDHRIQATIDHDLFRALLPPGDNELHLSAGIGLVFAKLQVDFALDLSDPADTAAVSAIYSF
jgi:long-subunit fatty acid transport protein